jgi:hypothetical protein
MKASEIVNRGVVVTKNEDKTMSYTGKPDFTEEAPEIYRTLPKGPNSRPRTKASLTNSYT